MPSAFRENPMNQCPLQRCKVFELKLAQTSHRAEKAVVPNLSYGNGIGVTSMRES